MLSNQRPRTNNHQSEVKALLHGLSVHLVGQTGKTDVAVELLCGWLWLANLLFILVPFSEPAQFEVFVSLEQCDLF